MIVDHDEPRRGDLFVVKTIVENGLSRIVVTSFGIRHFNRIEINSPLLWSSLVSCRLISTNRSSLRDYFKCQLSRIKAA